MAKYSKLIAAVVGSLLSWAVMHFGLDIDAAAQSAIVGAVASVAVYFAPKNAD